MSGYPEEVLQAAAEAIAKRFPAWRTQQASDATFTILDAVAPLLRAVERERIARMAEDLEATVPQIRASGVVTKTVPFADLIRQNGTEG